MASPSSRRATKRRRSSITELAFHGIHTSRLQKSEKCNPCVRYELSPMSRAAHRRNVFSERSPTQLTPISIAVFQFAPELPTGKIVLLFSELAVCLRSSGLPPFTTVLEIQLF